jgi:hypothetical protein
LQQGSYRGVPSAPGVLAYERIGGIEGNDETRVLVAMNMSDQRVHAGLDGACYTSRWTTAFSTHGGSANDTVQPADLMLAPFEGIVLLPTVSDRR